MATFTQAKNPYQILIIPLTVFSGLTIAFLSAEFTAVSCHFLKRKIIFFLHFEFEGLRHLRIGSRPHWFRFGLLWRGVRFGVCRVWIPRQNNWSHPHLLIWFLPELCSARHLGLLLVSGCQSPTDLLHRVRPLGSHLFHLVHSTQL